MRDAVRILKRELRDNPATCAAEFLMALALITWAGWLGPVLSWVARWP